MKHMKDLPVVSDIVVAIGAPKHDRRLSDKILAAFNHAYAVNELGVAGTLRRALEDAEQSFHVNAAERRLSDALSQADLWVDFVDARDAYRRLSELSEPEPKELDRAESDMMDAYKRWSYS
jgi:hypothetical protein